MDSIPDHLRPQGHSFTLSWQQATRHDFKKVEVIKLDSESITLAVAGPSQRPPRWWRANMVRTVPKQGSWSSSRVSVLLSRSHNRNYPLSHSTRGSGPELMAIKMKKITLINNNRALGINGNFMANAVGRRADCSRSDPRR